MAVQQFVLDAVKSFLKRNGFIARDRELTSVTEHSDEELTPSVRKRIRLSPSDNLLDSGDDPHWLAISHHQTSKKTSRAREDMSVAQKARAWWPVPAHKLMQTCTIPRAIRHKTPHAGSNRKLGLITFWFHE